MKRQAGFTLIELVMVIVILGILAAFALPRFADLGTEARAASLNGALGAVKSASSIAHADCLVTNCTATVTLEGSSIAMAFGYPTASTSALNAGIVLASQIAADFTVTVDTSTPPVTTVTATGAATPADCSFTYTQAADADTPPIISAIVDTTGC